MKKLILASFIFILYAGLVAQPSPAIPISEWFEFNRTPQKIQNNQDLKKTLNLGQDDEIITIQTKTDKRGRQHSRNQQKYKNIPIHGAIVMTHEQNGILKSANGHLVRNLSLNTDASISKETAFNLALNHINAEQYAWESVEAEQNLKISKEDPNASFFPGAELVIFAPGFNAATARLAYSLEVFSVRPLRKVKLFVDAQTGDILSEINLIRHGNVLGTGETRFYGSKDIACYQDVFNNKYYLKNTEKNIETRDGTPLTGSVLLNPIGEICENNSPHWGAEDSIAVGVHWATEQWHNYMNSTFQWNGYDGQGSKIINVVHYGNQMNGAFWTGHWASYGDGHGDYNPWASLDIVAHEITHGLIEHTANLIYNGESGALNESFADIFAVMVERNVLGDHEGLWIIGENITKNGNGLRNMSNDNIMYHGTGWHYSESDYGGVHTNSRVQNRWFYLLSQEIGIDNAAQICFYSLSNYLTPYSNYHDARNASIATADALFPGNSTIQSQICNAWDSVGVYGSCTGTESINITLPNTTVLTINNPINITWTNSDNISHVNIEYAITNGALIWQPIANYIETTDINSYTWNVPELDTNAFITIRVSNAANYATQDSTELLSMQSCPNTATFQGDSFHTCIGNELSFTNNSMGADHYEWFMNDMLFSTQTNFTWTADLLGKSTIELRSYHSIGCYSSHTEEVHISDSTNSSALFSYEKINNNVYFSVTNPNPYASYTWDFGDGNTHTETAVTHAYDEEGIYPVCLTVQNDCGIFQHCDQVVILFSNGTGGFCEPKWTQHSNSQDIRALVEIGDYIWIGTFGAGLVRQSKIDGSTEFFNNANSDLPDNRITSLEKDDSNHLWIGTHNAGIAKFDGTNWDVFNTSNSGLPHNHISTLLWNTNDTRLWIGTNGGGIAKFDGVVDWEIYKNSNSHLPSNRITALLEDTNGSVWIGTSTTGMAKISNGNWEVFNISNSDLPNNRITALLEADNGSIWIGTYNKGLVEFDGTNWNIFDNSNVGIINNRITALAKDQSGNIWIGTYTGGIVKHDTGWQVYNDSNSGLPTDRIYTLLADGNGDIWAGTADGFAKLNGASWEDANIPHSGLLNNQITTLLETEDHTIWIGVSELGVVKLDDTNWDTLDVGNSNLPDNRIYDLLEDQQLNVWIGTGAGLVKSNGIDWTTYNTSNSDLPHNHSRAVLEDLNGDIWVGTDGGGLAKFDGTNWTIFNSSNSALPSNNIRALLEDSSGNIWVGTNDNGLAKYDGSNWTIPNINFSNDAIRTLLEDSSGNIWVGTEGSGLNIFDGTNWNTPSNELSNAIIRTLLEDDGGNIWIGTNGDGLAKYDGVNWEFFNTSNSGLPSNLVITLLEDDNGAIWFGTYLGIGILHTQVNFEADISCSQDISYFQNKSYESIQNEWRINGETVSYDVDLSYVFEESGTYEVALIATDADGCTDVCRKSIKIPAAATELNSILPEYISICEADSVPIDLSQYGYISHEWTDDQGTLLDSDSIFIATQIGTIHLSIVDSCGGFASDSIIVLLGSDCVWPGDTNKDGTVNHLDLFAVGMAFGSTGTPRLGANNDWRGQVCPNWNTTYGREDINNKHADTNGDGEINDGDIQAILSNYGKSNEEAQPTQIPSIESSPYSLLVEFENINSSTSDIQLSLKIESNDGSNPIGYGFATQLLYDSPSNFDTIPRPLFPQYNVVGADVISVHRQFAKHTHLSFTGTNHQNRSFLSDIGLTSEGNERKAMVNYAIGDERELAGGDSIPYLRIIPEETFIISYTGDIIPLKGEYLDIYLPDEELSFVMTSSPVSCANSGRATIYPTDPTQSYSYLWGTGETTASISTPNIGIHQVTITDNTSGMEWFFSINIEGVEVLNLVIEDDGTTLNAEVSGGDGNYSYYWNNGATTSSIPNDNITDYSVTVSDGNGCTIFFSQEGPLVESFVLSGFLEEGISYLEWTTISKESGDYFIIEHSIDSISFNSLGELEANDNSLPEQSYSFNHPYPMTGKNHYRLRLINEDGTEEFSNVISLDFLGESKTGLQSIYPVPATENSLFLEYIATQEGTLEAEIIDVGGRIISKQIESLSQGMNQLSINLERITSGIYVLRLKEGNEYQSHKLPIVK